MVKKAMDNFLKDLLLGISMYIFKTNMLKTHTEPNTVRSSPRPKDVKLFINNIIYRMLCFILQRFMSYTVISHTNAHAVHGMPTIKHVELFGMDHRSTKLWLES